MRIIIKPSDIIKRTLWRRYQTYILRDVSEKEIQRIISEDAEFEITENDAYVIKLLTCVETENLIHRFNQTIEKTLEIKTIEIEDIKDVKKRADAAEMDIEIEESTNPKMIYVFKKNVLIDDVNEFMANFPLTWEPGIVYQNSLSDLRKYVAEFLVEIDKLDVITTKIKNISVELLRTGQIKKRLKFQY